MEHSKSCGSALPLSCIRLGIGRKSLAQCSRAFVQYVVDFVYHSQTNVPFKNVILNVAHLKMGGGQCKNWGKRAKYENKSYWKSSDLVLRACPCACSPASAWDSGRGGCWNSSAPWASCSAEGGKTLQKERKSLSSALKQHQPQPECSSSSWGLGGSSQCFFSSGSSLHTQLGTHKCWLAWEQGWGQQS